MSLVPYPSNKSQQVVLRHRNALVVHDPTSRRLELRPRNVNLSECPTCHRAYSIPSSSPDHSFGSSEGSNSIHPEYFRLLQDSHDNFLKDHARTSSPMCRLPRTLPIPDSLQRPQNGRSISYGEENSTPPPLASNQTSRIHQDAFSQNYYKTFFVEEKELGRGGKGVVMLVQHHIDGNALGHFACKKVPVGDNHDWLKKVLQEAGLLAKLSHPNIVSFRHVWLEDVKLNNFGPSVPCAFILQQYCNAGDLLHYVVNDIPRASTKEELKHQARLRRQSHGQVDRARPKRHYLSYKEIFTLFKDITSGLGYLHQSNLIHRDLKPPNCLLHREGSNITCLISDFGEVQPENGTRSSTGSTGTISYCAPEVLRKDATTGRYENFTYKSDMFSLGMTLYFMCFGRLPYRNANAAQEELDNIDELRIEISSWAGFVDERRERPELPPKLYQLLKKLLALNPLERPSAKEVLHAMESEFHHDAMPRVRHASPLTTISRPGRILENIDSMKSFQHASVAGDSSNGQSCAGSPVSDFELDETSPQQLTPRSKQQLLKPRIPAVSEQQQTPEYSDETTEFPIAGGGALVVPPSPTQLSQRGREISRSPVRLQRSVVSSSPLLPPRSPSPMLMLPPPPPLPLMERVSLSLRHRLIRLVFHDSPTWWYIADLLMHFALFMYKMHSLAVSCNQLIVAFPTASIILFFAALDLLAAGRVGRSGTMGPAGSNRGGALDPGYFRLCAISADTMSSLWLSGILLGAHFVILEGARTTGILCPNSSLSNPHMN